MAHDAIAFATLGKLDTSVELSAQLDDDVFAHRCGRAFDAFLHALENGQQALNAGRFWNAGLGLYVSRHKHVYCFFAPGTERRDGRPTFLLARDTSGDGNVEAAYDEAARRLALLRRPQ